MVDKRYILIQRSKRLAFLLRHDRDYPFDEHGWRSVDDLMINHGYSMEELCEIVETNNKQRYEFSADKTKIRARQGHSVPVDVELTETVPPDTLYHGTAEATLNVIMANGIQKMSRLYVHLSPTKEIATNVGKRHGKPVVLEIDSKSMWADGYRFYHSRNDVWLTEFVDAKYIKNKKM